MKSSLNSPSTHLGFCTDGHPGHILGIAAILKRMRQELFAINFVSSVWIAAPFACHNLIQTFLNEFVPKGRLYLVDVESRTDDKYFVQIGLSEIFQSINNRDYLICLDYDHLLVNSIRPLLGQHPKSVLVSSEVREEDILLDAPIFSQRRDLLTLNTSLIWGRVDRLRAIGELWAASYLELSSKLPSRNLVEYAFGLAVLRADACVEQCSPLIQGNIFNGNNNCILFHYGGDDPLSLYLKKELCCLGRIWLDGSSFCCPVEQIDKFLRAQLFEMPVNFYGREQKRGHP